MKIQEGTRVGKVIPATAVIFDLDGCLVDSEPLIIAVIADEARKMGIADVSDDYISARFLGVSMRDIFEQLAQNNAAVFLDDFVDRAEERIFREYREKLRRIEGAMEMLEGLVDVNIAIAIATGGSIRRMNETLERSELSPWFNNAAFSADQVESGKPAPDLFLLAAQELGVATEDCVVLEDSPHGVKGAISAGMRVIGFVGGSHLEGRREAHSNVLRQAGADAVFSRLTDVFLYLLYFHKRKSRGHTSN
jgi:beta-phosphoglucomutase-like phosphatase (HAD superfamily)